MPYVQQHHCNLLQEREKRETLHLFQPPPQELRRNEAAGEGPPVVASHALLPRFDAQIPRMAYSMLVTILSPTKHALLFPHNCRKKDSTFRLRAHNVGDGQHLQSPSRHPASKDGHRAPGACGKALVLLSMPSSHSERCSQLQKAVALRVNHAITLEGAVIL